MVKKKKQNSQFQEFIDKLLVVITKKYKLNALSLEVRISSKVCSMGDTIPFTISFNIPYKKALLYVYPIAIETFEHGEYCRLFDGLTHEIAHIITWNISELAMRRDTTKKEIDDATEELTEYLAILMRPTLDNEYNDIVKSLKINKAQKSTSPKKRVKKTK